ncbi:hypothetical protein SISSUDRAFT_1067167 [Sistotremastrum suecicum HHB10207 ss-3]|uniref:Uncharacterized protein n=1 Tax=Sistotremastrum suecicum HHB10207 ss-3 TaxID=1314776 RepID=A0A165XFE2_9AGAM|nr:hypothetical protein SISSUDRAFT_1067167 [Sistotremastrum suecicum HHB10207 ss-3]
MTSSSISLPQAILVSFFCETLLYGVASVLYILCLFAISRKTARGSAARTFMTPSTLLFFFTTIHTFGVFARNLDAFVSYPGGPGPYFMQLTTPVKTIIQVGQMGAILTADALSVYRTFIVYSKSKIAVIVPLLSWIATFVAAAGLITAQHLVSVNTSIFSSTVTKWTMALLSTSVATTGFATGMIVWRLWSARRAVRQAVSYSTGSTFTTRFAIILVESAALYSFTNLVYLILYAMQQNAEGVVSGFEVPLASITFSLITLRVEAIKNESPTPDSIRSHHKAEHHHQQTRDEMSLAHQAPSSVPPVHFLHSLQNQGSAPSLKPSPTLGPLDSVDSMA